MRHDFVDKYCTDRHPLQRHLRLWWMIDPLSVTISSICTQLVVWSSFKRDESRRDDTRTHALHYLNLPTAHMDGDHHPYNTTLLLVRSTNR